MRTWIRLLQSTPEAREDFLSHLAALIDAEDRVSKVHTPDDLAYQRGKVDGIRLVLFAVTANHKK
jgi:hypothetical protein